MMFFKKRADSTNSTAPDPAPRVVDTTGNWRGNDGQWSTFYINVGDKNNNGGGQNFEVLPSTHFGVTVVPFPTEWCNTDCATSRGVGTVNGNQTTGLDTSDSSTWSPSGTYNLDLPYWWQGNKSDPPTGLYGLDYLGIGRGSSKSWVAKKMYVAGTKSKEFYIGQFGLAPGALNVGGGNGPQVDSIISSFQKSKVTPSTSYGYTAGAKYRNSGNGITGSLVLGGYDKARFNPDNQVSINMPSIQNTSLVVGVQSISYQPDINVDQNVLSITEANVKGFMATIDSTFPYLWLPDKVCDRFATLFNLNYNSKTNFYTVNSTGAQNNDQQNAVVTFKIGSDPSGSGSDRTTINLPLKAFDLTYFDPENKDNTTRYFPVRRSTNGMFVLGRTLLQEAYIIADYSRANFTVAQVPLLDAVPEPKIATIYDPSYVPPSPIPIPTSGGSKGLSGGAIAGIVIGVLAVALGAALGIFIWWKKRRERNAAPPAYKEATEIDTSAAGNEVKHRRVSELDTQPPGAPKSAGPGGFYGDDRSGKDLSPFPPISEMDSPPAELYSPPTVAATPHSEGSGGDYFIAGAKLGRRHATRESSANNTPGTPPPFTPIAELPGDDGAHLAPSPQVSPMLSNAKLSSGSISKRETSVTRSQSNIDEVMKRTSIDQSPAPPAKDEPAGDEKKKPIAEGEEGVEGEPSERRPSHTRGASDATVQSDTTVVSQPTPEELERWALAEDEQPRRPLSE